MDENSSLFENALKEAEKKLSMILEKDCSIKIKPYLDDDLLNDIQEIDHKSFRVELQYNLEEIIKRYYINGFTLFSVECGDEVFAYLYGYNDPEDSSSFFLDTVATLKEGKGIGSILVLLILLYCYDLRYKRVVLYTEERDEKGRNLLDFYEDLGFTQVYLDPSTGMKLNNFLFPMTLKMLYNKYLNLENLNLYHYEFGECLINSK